MSALHARLDADSRTRRFLDTLSPERTEGRWLRRQHDGSVVGDWFGCELSSVFQPIVEQGSERLLGHEAFLRCLGTGERALSPWTLFSANADDARLIALDRLARTLHALNYLARPPGDGLLYLNVHGRLLAAVSGDHGRAFRKVVDALGLPPERVVIETPLAASRQPDLLSFVLRNYRHNGFQVAINLDRPAAWPALALHAPAQFVKIDAQRLEHPAAELAELARLAHEFAPHTRFILTRVETAQRPAIPPGLFAQGYGYAPPEAGAQTRG